MDRKRVGLGKRKKAKSTHLAAIHRIWFQLEKSARMSYVYL
jgi:hypothetical protein